MDKCTPPQSRSDKPHGPLPRRGLIAGLAALAAGGLATKGMVPRAEAQTTGGTQTFTNSNGDALQGIVAPGAPNAYGVWGDNSSGFGVVGTSNAGTGVSGGAGSGTGVVGNASTGWGIAGFTDSTTAPPVGGVYGTSTAAGSPAYGVYGSATSGPGVAGHSNATHGVYGETNDASGQAGGVYGVALGNSTAVGVRGEATNNAGVFGVARTNTGDGNMPGVFGMALGSPPSYGVRGDSANVGVVGSSSSGIGTYGTSATSYGAAGTSGSSIGVYGNSTSYIAVYGIAGGSQPAVYGIGTGGGTGVQGESTTGFGVYGHSVSGHAGHFDGPVYVNGDFTVAPGYAKSGAVVLGDSVRRLYAVESPESWFEDFGGGTLSAGRATVALDPEFAATVRTDNYRVFLTAEGPTNGLYVSNKTPLGFVVQEQGQGTSSAPFSYRVVAKRKDIVGARLERIVLPTVPPPPPVPIPPAPVPPAPTVIKSVGVTGAPVAAGQAAGTPPAPSPIQPPNREPLRPGR